MLRFTHSNWKAVTELYAICNSSWGELMYRLRDYMEGKKPGPHWKAEGSGRRQVNRASLL